MGDSVADPTSSSWLVGVTVVVVEVVGVECFDDPDPDDPMNGGCIAVAVLVVVIDPPPISIVVRSAVVVVVLLFPAPPPPDIRPNSILVMGVRGGGGGAPPAKGVVMPVPLGVELLRVVDAEEVELAMMDDDGRRGGVRDSYP